MPDDIIEQPLARAVLTKLARLRGADDPLGSLASAVLNGEATLRDAAAHPWHSQGLNDGFAAALDEQRRQSPETRADTERQAQRLRDAGDALLRDPDGIDQEGNDVSEPESHDR